MTIKIVLSQDEQQALEKLAWIERRRVNQQAALIIRHELIERGYLSADAVSTPAQAREVENVHA